jgi:hypothetical protein
MIIAAVAVAVAAVLTMAFFGRGRPPRPRDAGGRARVDDVMSASPCTISSQLTVEEIAHRVPMPQPHAVFAVIDPEGHALGALFWDDVMRMPHGERPARLAGEVARGPVVAGSDGLVEVLERPGLAKVATAVVVNGIREPVGLLDVTAARREAPSQQAHDLPTREGPPSPRPRGRLDRRPF